MVPVEMDKSNPFTTAADNKRPLILDGAIGSQLQQAGVPSHKKAWMTFANTDHPEIVLRIHRDYIAAGADIITTNTFRTNPAALSEFSREKKEELLRAALKLALEAKVGKNVYVAASNAPAEDCYQQDRTLSLKELKHNHHEHISLLMDNGADFILNETQSHFDEIKIICEYCANNDIPFVMSIYLDENLKLLSGEAPAEVIRFIRDYGPLAMGFNCISPAQFHAAEKDFNYNWGYYLNCGSGNPEDSIITCGFSPEDYLSLVKDTMIYSPSFIGACCGSGPEHIIKIKEYLDGKD
jgi:methionine synthase I (cobalamin-dependent)